MHEHHPSFGAPARTLGPHDGHRALSDALLLVLARPEIWKAVESMAWDRHNDLLVRAEAVGELERVDNCG